MKMKFNTISCFVFWAFLDLTSQTPMKGNNVRDAKKNEFPFVVSIGRKHELSEYYPELTHYCTGSLITQHHVLTAEHCFVDEQPNNTYVLYGSNNLKCAKRADVLSWITYKMWMERNGKSTFMSHDIAVVTLKTRINDSKIIPITPLKFVTPDLYGSYAIAAGWGRTDTGSQTQILKVARFKIISNRECESRVSELTEDDEYFPSRFFCSVADPWALLGCGDSGGPLIRDNLLVGISLGSCPKDDEVVEFSKDLNEKQMNLHLGFHYYREFIRNVTTDS